MEDTDGPAVQEGHNFTRYPDLSNPDDLIDFTDSEDESELPHADLVSYAEQEANKATLNNYLLTYANNNDEIRISNREKIEQSKAIIDRAREYQQELFEKAKDENVIAVLDTGSGKTLIAALLIRHYLQQELIDRSRGKSAKIIFFLVNSVHLARQQARFLSNNLAQKVIPLFGDASYALWEKAEWDKIFAENSVVVCTAAVLDLCLMRSYLKIGQISLLVFDEAHHCKKNHPYSTIIRDYYLKWDGDKPRIFGMTASPVDSRRDINTVAEDLQSLLQSKIVTTSDMSVFDFAPRAKDVRWIYPPLNAEFETPLYSQLMPLCGFFEDFKSYFRFARTASRHLGAWAADRIWQFALPTSEHESRVVLAKFERSRTYTGLTESENRVAALDSIREAISIVQQHPFEAPQVDSDLDLSPKVRKLYSELKNRFSAKVATRSIVFVEERLTALILCDLFKALDLPNLRAGVLMGTAPASDVRDSWKDQEAVMEKFRTGIFNIIFATSVAEEGIDIPQCNLVIRFDLYRTPIQYMQSRGRARMKDSIFVHMIEENNQSQEADVNFAMDQDDYIRRFCQQLPPDRLLGQGSKLKQLMAKDASCRSFQTSAGVLANYSNSLLLLSRYAESLRKIGASSSEVYEEMIGVEENMFQYKVILPVTDDKRTAVVKGAKGEARTNKTLAKRSAAWHCLAKLRKAQLLDENLNSIFFKAKPANLNARIAVCEDKDDYDRKVKPDFWIESGATSSTLPTKLFITHVSVGPKSPSWCTDGLLMLTRVPLPDIPGFPVFVDDNVEKQVQFNHFIEPVAVTPDQIEALTTFTLRGVFQDFFNKVYTHKSTSMSYWLAPPAKGELKGTFESIVDVGELLAAQLPERQGWKASGSAAEAEGNAKKWCNAFLVDPRSGRFRYFTGNILPGRSIWDPIPESAKAVQKRLKNTIIEFSDSTWGAKRKDAQSAAQMYDSNQPVLSAKVVIAGRNFLEECPTDPKRYAICHIAPQPLELGRISFSVAQTCLLWPSILRRLEGYLIVREAFEKLDLSEVPLDLALEAYTQEGNTGAHGLEIDSLDLDGDDVETQLGQKKPRTSMNYERLEFIGDSLLKMMTTITVYNHTTCDEEGMHCRRMELISNRRLCTTASAQQYELFRYIRVAGEPWRDTWYPEFLELEKGRVIKLTDKHRKHTLGQKTIADVCEATIGACIMSTRHLPTEEKFNLGIKAITKFVKHPDHAINSWKEIPPMYKPAHWVAEMNDPIANDLANKVFEATGYRFKHPRLARSAFTHSSDQHSPVQNLQRLEFLGDACLDWVCIWWLFSTNPTRGPQWLTEHKMAMVSNKFLAALAVYLGFHKFIHAYSMSVSDDIARYASKVQEAWGEKDVKPDFWTRVVSEGHVPKVLADVVESYLGAVFVDSGFDYREIEHFFEKHVKWFFEDIEAYDTFANRHPTTYLYRLLEREFRCRKGSFIVQEHSEQPTTSISRDNDQDDDEDAEAREPKGDEDASGTTMYVAWFVHGNLVAHSKGRSVKYAKVRTSRTALKKLGTLSIDEFRSQWGCDCARKEADVAKGKKEKVNGAMDGIGGER
ncbi:Dicer dimerization domain-containing protein [Cladophialophora immunda]|nr:Dicer dimerization domain-containing protein [Cladophialophora immunda]